MKLLILIGCIALAYSNGFSSFFSQMMGGNYQDVINVCCYSTSPPDYAPKCYPCATVVYTQALLACVNNTVMPKNITFKSADCMERNCQINYPQTPPSKFPAIMASFFSRRRKRDIREDANYGAVNVIQEVKVYVQPKELEFDGTMDYM